MNTRTAAGAIVPVPPPRPEPVLVLSRLAVWSLKSLKYFVLAISSFENEGKSIGVSNKQRNTIGRDSEDQ